MAEAISIHTPHAGSDTKQEGTDMTKLISIHTPHAGSDRGRPDGYTGQHDFNPHSPCGERRILDKLERRFTEFQSTLPMRGATIRLDKNDTICSIISIHTPHAGSDCSLHLKSVAIFYFNPHSPCGERHWILGGHYYNANISIHTPHAGSDEQADSK